YVARLEIEGESLLLLKPTEKVEHGGRVQILEGSEQYEALAELIDRMRAPVHCADDNDFDEFFKGVELMDMEETLRRAAFTLASRIPTDAELAKVRNDGKRGLEEVVREL